MAGTVERTLALKLIADVGSLDKSLKKSEGRLKKFGKSAASWGKAFTGSLAIAGVEKVVDVLGDAWEGFRSGQKVAAQLGVTWRNLGLAAGGLAGTLDRVTAAATRMGMSDDDAVLAFNSSIKRTRDSEKSFRELQIAMNLVANGSAPNLEAAMKIIQQAGKGSARVVDKFGLTAKTSGGRIRELGRQVQGAAKKAADLNPLGVLINGINEDLEGIVGSLATGDIDGAMGAIATAGDRIATAWNDMGDVLPPPLRDFVDNVAPKVASGLQAAGTAADALGSAFGRLTPIIEPFLNLIGATFSTVTDGTESALRGIAAVLSGDFGGAWKQVERVVSNAVRGMVAAWNQLDISVPPFELSWGGGTLFPGTPFAIDIPGGNFRFWSGTGDLFPDVGRSWDTDGGGRGPSGGIPKGRRNKPKSVGRTAPSLPGHEDGLDYVPYDGYVAALHKGERVMTAQENKGGGGNVYVTVNVAPGTSPSDVGRELNRYLSAFVQRGGRLGYR
jgi:hypothetical protein